MTDLLRKAVLPNGFPRLVLIVLGAVVVLWAVHVQPDINQHPIALFYLYIVIAGWIGSVRQALVGAMLVSLGGAFTIARFPAFGFEDIAFAIASALMLHIIGTERAKARSVGPAATSHPES